MSLTGFIAYYFQSVPALLVPLALLLASGALAVALKGQRSSITKSRIMVALFLMLVLTWSFLPVSLAWCGAFLPAYEQSEDLAVRLVLGYSLLTSATIAVPVTAIAAALTPRRILARLSGKLSPPSEHLMAALSLDSSRLGIRPVGLRQLGTEVPIACTLGDTIVITSGLQRLLDQDELRAVLTHELAHVRDHDSRVRILFSVFRRVLFFDPILRRVESRAREEAELAADEFSAFFTRKPLSLASALLKIAAHPGGRVEGLTDLAFVGVWWSTSGSRLKARIERLVRLAEELEFPQNVTQSMGNIPREVLQEA